MCLAQGPQRSDAGEARTRGPSDFTTEPLRSLKLVCKIGFYRTFHAVLFVQCTLQAMLVFNYSRESHNLSENGYVAYQTEGNKELINT